MHTYDHEARLEMLSLPESEATVIHHYSLDTIDLAAVATARTPATRLATLCRSAARRYSSIICDEALLPACMLDYFVLNPQWFQLTCLLRDHQARGSIS